jgi:hypothetical protein
MQFVEDKAVQISYNLRQLSSIFYKAARESNYFDPTQVNLPFETEASKEQFYLKYNQPKWYLLDVVFSEEGMSADELLHYGNDVEALPPNISVAYVIMNSVDYQMQIIVSGNDSTVFHVHIEYPEEPIIASVARLEELIEELTPADDTVSGSSVSIIEPASIDDSDEDISPAVASEPTLEADIPEEADNIALPEETPREDLITDSTSIESPSDNQAEEISVLPEDDAMADPTMPIDNLEQSESTENEYDLPYSIEDEFEAETDEPALETPNASAPPQTEEPLVSDGAQSSGSADIPVATEYGDSDGMDLNEQNDSSPIDLVFGGIIDAIAMAFSPVEAYGNEIDANSSGSSLLADESEPTNFEESESTEDASSSSAEDYDEPVDLSEMPGVLVETEIFEADVTDEQGVDLLAESSGIMLLAASLPIFPPGVNPGDEAVDQNLITYFDVDFFNYAGTIELRDGAYGNAEGGFNRIDDNATDTFQFNEYTQWHGANPGHTGEQNRGHVNNPIMGIAQDTLNSNGEFVTNFKTYNDALLFPTQDIDDRTLPSLDYYAKDTEGTLLSTIYPDYKMPFIRDASDPTYYVFDSSKYHIHVDPSAQVEDLNNDGIPDTTIDENGVERIVYSKELALFEGTQPNLRNNDATWGGFYPFSNDLPNEAEKYNFSLKLTVPFEMPKTTDRKIEKLDSNGNIILDENGKPEMEDMIYRFNGDDDLWVYIDGKLVLDLGGMHGSGNIEDYIGTINFTSGLITMSNIDGSVNANGDLDGLPPNSNGVVYWSLFSEGRPPGLPVNRNISKYVGMNLDLPIHTMNVFYMERNPAGSNLYMRFNIPNYNVNRLKLIKYTDEYIDSSKKFLFDVYYMATDPSKVTGGVSLPTDSPSPYPAPDQATPSTSPTPTAPLLDPRMASPPFQESSGNGYAIYHSVVWLSKNDFQYFDLNFSSTTHDLWYKIKERNELADGNHMDFQTLFQGDNIPNGYYGYDNPRETPWIRYSDSVRKPYGVTYINSKHNAQINVSKSVVGAPEADADREFTFSIRVLSYGRFTFKNPDTGENINSRVFYDSEGKTAKLEENGEPLQYIDIPSTLQPGPSPTPTPIEEPGHTIKTPEEATKEISARDYVFNLKNGESIALPFVLDDDFQTLYYDITEVPEEDYATSVTSIYSDGTIAGNRITGEMALIENILFRNTYAPDSIKLYKTTDHDLMQGVGAEFDLISNGKSLDIYYKYTVNVLNLVNGLMEETDAYFNVVSPDGDGFEYTRAKEAGFIVSEAVNTQMDGGNIWTSFTIKAPIKQTTSFADAAVTFQINSDSGKVSNFITAFSGVDQRLFVLSPEYCNVYLDNTTSVNIMHLGGDTYYADTPPQVTPIPPHTVYLTTRGNSITITDISWNRNDYAGVQNLMKVKGDFTNWSSIDLESMGNEDTLGILTPLNGAVAINGDRMWYQKTMTFSPTASNNNSYRFYLIDPYFVNSNGGNNYAYIFHPTESTNASFSLEDGENSPSIPGRMELLKPRSIPRIDAEPIERTGLQPGQTYTLQETYVDETYDPLGTIPDIRTTDSENFVIYWAEEDVRNQPDRYISDDGKSIVINNNPTGASPGSILVHKTIDSAWFPHGNPIFTYKLERFTSTDSSFTKPLSTLYGTIEFKPQNNEISSGELSKTLRFDYLEKGYLYRVTELNSIRYQEADISTTDGYADYFVAGQTKTLDAEANHGVMLITDQNYEGHTVFENTKVNNQNYSHTATLSNTFALPAPEADLPGSGPSNGPVIHTVTFHSGTATDVVHNKYVAHGGYVKTDVPDNMHGIDSTAKWYYFPGAYNSEGIGALPIDGVQINHDYDVYPFIKLDNEQRYHVQFMRYNASGRWVEDESLAFIGSAGSSVPLPMGAVSDENGSTYYDGWFTASDLLHAVTQTITFNRPAYIIVDSDALKTGSDYETDTSDNRIIRIYAKERVTITYNYIYPTANPSAYPDVSNAYTVSEYAYKSMPVTLPTATQPIVYTTPGEHGRTLARIINLSGRDPNYSNWRPLFEWGNIRYNQVMGWSYNLPELYYNNNYPFIPPSYTADATNLNSVLNSFIPFGDITLYAEWSYTGSIWAFY